MIIQYKDELNKVCFKTQYPKLSSKVSYEHMKHSLAVHPFFQMNTATKTQSLNVRVAQSTAVGSKPAQHQWGVKKQINARENKS